MAVKITSLRSQLYLILPLLVAVLLPLSCYSADPDPLQDFCVGDLDGKISVNGFPCKPVSEVKSGDFFYDGLAKEGNTSNAFGAQVTPANVLSFAGLNSLGIAMNRVDFAPGGLNAPHSHPHASEAGVIIKGKLLVGFVTTDNVLHSKVLKQGEMFVIPRGLMHFQRNVGEGKALAITTFNSQLPGVVVFSTTLFAAKPAIPEEVLTQTFQVDKHVISGIKSKFGS